MRTLLRQHLAGLLVIAAIVASHAEVRAQSRPDTLLDGAWLSDGYGQAIEIRGNLLQIYELTSVSCIAGASAKRHSGSKAGGVAFEGGSTGTLLLTPGDTPDRLLLNEGGVSGVALRRTSGLPEACSHKTPNTAEWNYEVFWRTFSEQYPFFGLRKIDWPAVDKQFHPQVTRSTSPAELFKTLRSMIEPLSDAHTGIDASGVHSGHFDGYRPGSEVQQASHTARIREIIQRKYVIGKIRDYCHELELGSKPRSNLHFALVGDSIGYLRIDSFPSHCDNALDQIFGEASELRGLIIDERLNTGGYDSFGIALASRLTDHEYLAYSKVARNDVIDNGGRTAPQRIMVRPSLRPGFSGQVVLLTGHESVSAAEVFAMALFGREPVVTRIGEDTQGVFSDVMERSLPNRWHFRLPNEIYLADDGRAYDVTGVPPDVRVSVFSEQDLKDGRDSALEKAIEVLGKARK